MNRLQTPKTSSFKHSSTYASPFSDSRFDLDLAHAESERRDRFEPSHYSLFVPLHYEPGYAYPLLVWLHGDGGCEREVRQLMPYVSVRNYVAAAVRGTAAADERQQAFTWGECAAATSEAAERVREAIDAARQRFSIHPERIFVAGNGCGGTMALRLALRYPEWFAGAVSLGGPVPAGNCPLGRVNAARRLPLLLATCRESREYPMPQVASDLRLLHAAGFSLSLRQYPGEHDLTTVMLADMDRWLMGQVCPTTAGASA
jgi:phospholipase/carboxylesterase